MTSRRPTPINDDHGDQFPGALPAPSAPTIRIPGAAERLVRMPSAHAERERRAAGRRTPTRGQTGRRPGRDSTGLVRMRQITRSSIDRLDRYTLDVLDPARPDASA